MSKGLNKAPAEQAGGDERDFQAEGAQEVPSPVSQEYDRHLISLLRKGEALPGHQEEAADEIERLRDWNDHLNNTVLPNILNPNFLMLMKGGERLLDLCTKDGKFIGVSLNDMKDVFDWMVTHARIAPDHAALAQPSPAQTQPSPAPTLRAAIDVANDRFEVPVAKWGTDLVGEEERPEVAEVAFVLRNIGAMDAEDIDGDNVDLRFEDAEGRDTGCDVSIVEYAEKAADLFEQHDRIVGALRAEIAMLRSYESEWELLLNEHEQQRDAALAEVERLRQFERICEGLPQDAIDGGWTVQGIRCYAKRLEDQLKSALARVEDLERQEPVVRAYGVLPPFAEKVLAKLRRFYGCASDFESGGVDIGRHWLDLLTQLGLLNRVQRSPALWEISQQGEDLLEAPVAKAQHSVPGKYDDVLLPFLKSMEHELHANTGKGDRPGWLQMDRKTALLEIYYHLGKLQKATKDNDAAGIVEYAADVANMSMMLVDVCGLLAAAPGKEGV